MYTKEDLKKFKQRKVKATQITQQLENFEKGFAPVCLAESAIINNGIISITSEEEDILLESFEKAARTVDMVKMVPASGSATRMFKDLFTFQETYQGTEEEFLNIMQHSEPGSINDFFAHLDDYPFYSRLGSIVWETGQDLEKMLKKRQYKDILEYILTDKGLNYGDTPKGLIDFHIYRDFVRTAFDEHLAEAALYCSNGKEAEIHFTVSEEYLNAFKHRQQKVAKVFEQKFNIKYHITYSVQKPSTDMVSVTDKGELLRNEQGEIIFRPGGHGALIHNLDDIKADIVFIKNIDNVVPDRKKEDTVKYKKLLAGELVYIQNKVFDYMHQLDKRNITDTVLADIERFIAEIGYKIANKPTFKRKKDHAKYLQNLLNRPIRICGMVKNEGEPGGGPFWVAQENGGLRLMIVESAQIDLKNKEQKKIFESATHFNPVDLVCGLKNYKGKKFDLEDFIDYKQGFITKKSYKGKDIKAQELPGLWNGSMAEWITLFVEVPLATFAPVKTVFDLQRVEHRNVLRK